MSSIKNLLIENYTLHDSIKEYKGYKVKPPEETIKTIESAFSKLNLKVSYTPNNLTALRKFYPFQTGTTILHPIKNNDIVLIKAFGKGVTSILSRASGAAETIERFTGYGCAQPFVSQYLPLFKRNDVWKQRRKYNKLIEKEFSFHYIDNQDLIPPELKKQYHQMTKSVCYSLTRKQLFCFPEEFYIESVGSNGLASGNTFEEAALHAIHEVVERLGAMYIVDTLPICNMVDEDSITHPTLKKLIEAVYSLGVQFKILDFSNIFNIPLIAVIFDHPEWKRSSNPYTQTTNMQFPRLGVGVDSDPQDAIMRCFTEFIQTSFPMSLAVFHEEEFQCRFDISKIKVPDDIKTLFRTSALRSVTGGEPDSVNLREYLKKERKKITISDINSLYDVNQKIEIIRVVNALKKCDIEVLIQDITHPVLKFPVIHAMISGGKDYFSTIPLSFYNWIVLNEKNENIRYSLVKNMIKNKITTDPVHEIIKSEKWCTDPTQTDIIKLVIQELCWGGKSEQVLGVPVNKYYFLGMLYLRMKKYEQSENCFQAAVCGDFNNMPAFLGLAYTYLKNGKNSQYEEIKKHIETISKEPIDIEQKIKEMDNPVIDPNPLEPCDLNCKSKNKEYLCKTCFFNYVSEEDFMIKKTDNLFKNSD